jgi:hypothetical protein
MLQHGDMEFGASRGEPIGGMDHIGVGILYAIHGSILGGPE